MHRQGRQAACSTVNIDNDNDNDNDNGKGDASCHKQL